ISIVAALRTVDRQDDAARHGSDHGDCEDQADSAHRATLPPRAITCTAPRRAGRSYGRQRNRNLPKRWVLTTRRPRTLTRTRTVLTLPAQRGQPGGGG